MRININGTWKTMTRAVININGTWKNITRGVINIAGTWKSILFGSPSIAQQVEIDQTTSIDYIVTLVGYNYFWTNYSSSTYKFQKSVDNGSTWSDIDSGSITNPSSGSYNTKQYQLLSITPNIANLYRFQVTTTSLSGQSATSTSNSTTVQGARNVTNIATTSKTSSSITLSFSSSYSSSYKLYYRETGSLSGYSLYDTYNTTSATVSGLSGSTEYAFYVIPYTGLNGQGYAGYASNTSEGGSPSGAPYYETTSAIIPSITQDVDISQSTDINYTVTLTGTNYYWTGYYSGSYKFQKSTNGGSTWSDIDSGSISNPSSGGSNTKTYIVTSITPNIANLYRFQVTVTSPTGQSTTSTSGSTTIQGPRTVTNLTSPSQTYNSIDLTFSSLYSSSYQLYYTAGLPGPGVTYTLYNTYNSTSATVSGLSSSTYYSFYVVPYTGLSGLGYSGYDSSVLSVSTSASPVPGSFTYSISNSTVTPTQPSAYTNNFSSDGTQISYDWNDTADTTYWVSSISGGSEGTRSNPRYVSNDSWSTTPGQSYTTSVYSVNENRKATVSWSTSTNAGSYVVSFSGATQSSPITVVGNSLELTASGSSGSSVTVNSVTAFSNGNGTGFSRGGTLSGSSSVTIYNGQSGTRSVGPSTAPSPGVAPSVPRNISGSFVSTSPNYVVNWTWDRPLQGTGTIEYRYSVYSRFTQTGTRSFRYSGSTYNTYLQTSYSSSFGLWAQIDITAWNAYGNSSTVSSPVV